jgi:hypothetical protein
MNYAIEIASTDKMCIKFHEVWCRRSSNIEALSQKFESL